MTDKMREAFEEWYMTNTFAHIDHISVFYNDLNCYPAPIANHCWKAWQAAQSAAVPVVGDVTLPLAQLAYERAFGESEDIDFCLRIARNVAALIQPTNSITAAELATLREKAVRIEQVEKERDEANARLHDVSVDCATAEQEREELRKDAAKVIHAEQIRIAAVAAVREVTGCPDIKGKDGAYLVDSLIVNLIEMQDDAAIAGEK